MNTKESDPKACGLCLHYLQQDGFLSLKEHSGIPEPAWGAARFITRQENYELSRFS